MEPWWVLGLVLAPCCAAEFRDIFNISDYIGKRLCLPWDSASQISITMSVINLEPQLPLSEIQGMTVRFS